MLNILQKNDLFNVLVVVTRYFGGTLLGTGGLVRAYSEATLKALGETNMGFQELGYELKITVKYKDLERLKYYCQKHGINIIEIMYENNIICMLELTNEEKEKLLDENQKEIEILKCIVLAERYIRTNIEK